FGAVGALLLVAAASVWYTCPAVSKAGGRPPAGRLASAGLRSLILEPANATMLLGNTLHQATAGAVGTYVAAYLAEYFRLPLREVAPWLVVIAAGAVAGSF